MSEIMVRFDDLRKYCETRRCNTVPLEYIKQITVEVQNPADAVQVVMCHECIWMDKDGSCAWHPDTKLSPYDYCSYGDRREE